MIIPASFFQRADVVEVARDMIGLILCTEINGVHCAGRIIETEAYAGVNDRASHSFGNRRTPRNQSMYGPGGHAYVYLCYGIHHLFNVVTNRADHPQGVLVRAVTPLRGLEVIRQRLGRADRPSGPGLVTRALGIDRRLHDGHLLDRPPVWIEWDGLTLEKGHMVQGPRIGVDYAGEDALLPYRFRWIFEDEKKRKPPMKAS